MKFLKILVGVLVLLLLFFVIKGLITPSLAYESEINVSKSIKESWAVMQDESNLSQWLEGYQKSELVSGTAGTVGAVSKIYFDQGGQETIITETIIEIQPNEKITMNFSMDFMDMDYEVVFSENNGGGTNIKSKTITKGNGWFARSMVSFMKGAMVQQEDGNMDKLKKVIESNTKNYFMPKAIPMEEAQPVN